MTPTHKINVDVLASSKKEADEKAQYLTEIARHIDLDNLKVLAGAAKKPGMNGKIQQFKMFL
jgi:hemerythrin-like domain-containing protein